VRPAREDSGPMRFMIQLWSDETRPASPARVHALARYNEELAQAGVLLAAEGLVASPSGMRIALAGGERVLTPGPFRDAPRLGAGFWIVRVGEKREALEWGKRCPLAEGDVLEVRELYGFTELSLHLSDLAAT
jgi:hypothetical protein